MKRVAIITPFVLPVPATKGGAVEGLITKLIEDNEKFQKIHIDLFTLYDKRLNEHQYLNTSLLTLTGNSTLKKIDRSLDAFYRRAKKYSAKRLLDYQIVSEFSEMERVLSAPYDAIVVENHMSTALRIVKTIHDKCDTPVYFHMHNDVDVYRSPEYIRELVKYGVQFIAVSNYIKSRILSFDKNALVHVLYNGVSLADCPQKDITREIPQSFLYSGRIIPEKGVKELVLAFEKLVDAIDLKDRDGLKLDIIGFSDYKTKYEKHILELVKPYKQYISCKKRISASKILKRYYDYDVVVMPTKNEEPFGLVALETLARGIPLVTTKSGALPEVVDDCAIIVNKNDNLVDELTNSMHDLISSTYQCKELSDKGYARARGVSEFNIDNYYSRFIDIIVPTGMNETISVIVPVYNIENYIEISLKSLITQTYKNLEIILVDDGSTDSSGSICEKVAKEDDRIRVVHQANQGLSAARNTGLDIAKGEYIFFCDSDDYLQKDALEKMLNIMNRDHADIVACGIMHVGDNEGMFTSPQYGIWSGHEAVIQMMRSNNICTVAWNKLYKRELFRKLRFPIGALHEDEATIYKALYHAKLVSFTPEPYYNYVQRNTGIMGESVSKRIVFFLDAIQKRIQYFTAKGEEELAEHSLITMCDGIKYGYRNEKDSDARKKLAKEYSNRVNIKNVPKVMGVKKSIALILWKYIKY
ncbi:glycosyltransferase [Butyrivibrio sp. AC2005]|uniref:glycosyltransferase n=1 Tax=Butyrivibrio sp. AC2005 TaxID=1280672 RepID=UPI0003FFC2E2|nr:glycosyltransferase [Butyrivibrio sp. AC2005]